MSGLLGSMAGSWQILQAGMDTVLDEVLSRPAIEPPPPIEELSSRAEEGLIPRNLLSLLFDLAHSRPN